MREREKFHPDDVRDAGVMAFIPPCDTCFALTRDRASPTLLTAMVPLRRGGADWVGMVEYSPEISGSEIGVKSSVTKQEKRPHGVGDKAKVCCLNVPL